MSYSSFFLIIFIYTKYIELQQTPYLNKYRKQNRYHKIQNYTCSYTLHWTQGPGLGETVVLHLARGQSDKIKNDWPIQKRNAWISWMNVFRKADRKMKHLRLCVRTWLNWFDFWKKRDPNHSSPKVRQLTILMIWALKF